MIETATGVVLRTRRLTETSLIIHWITPSLGRLATVAKGALRPKSPFRGKLDLFYRADFSFSRSRRSDLHNLLEVSLRETYPVLRQDLDCLRHASYCAALVEHASETETPLPAIYELISGLLQYLGAHGAQPQAIFAFELKLLSELGLQPDLEQSRLNPGTRLLAQALAGKDWSGLARLSPSAAQVTELRHFLHGFLICHLEKIPRGREGESSPENPVLKPTLEWW